MVTTEFLLEVYERERETEGDGRRIYVAMYGDNKYAHRHIVLD